MLANEKRQICRANLAYALESVGLSVSRFTTLVAEQTGLDHGALLEVFERGARELTEPVEAIAHALNLWNQTSLFDPSFPELWEIPEDLVELGRLVGSS